MLHLIRSLETNLRTLVRNLRQAPRYGPRLPFTLSMLDDTADGRRRRPVVTLTGITRNISETGMALMVPSIQKGDHHLAATNRRLLIVLELPTGPIRLQAAPIRYERIGRGSREGGYLIGVRIISMSLDDKLRFHRYLHRLTRGATLTAKGRTVNNQAKSLNA
jgi:PilZ domain-containing protein